MMEKSMEINAGDLLYIYASIYPGKHKRMIEFVMRYVLQTMN